MPKDVEVPWIGYDKEGNIDSIEVKRYHFEHEEDIEGWYYFGNDAYLTKTALKKLYKPKVVEKIITDTEIRTETVTNDYRTFTVYNLSDAKEIVEAKEVILNG